MHMISKKDLSDAEMDTLTKSFSPTIVITANGEVQTHEEAKVYVKELGIFLTMKVLENTPAVLSLGKLFDENGYSYEWINGQKQTSHQKRDSDTLQHGELRSYRGSSLSSSSSDLHRGSSSTSKTPSRQESHSSSSSSTSSSSPTVSEIQIREREDAINSDTSPVHVSNLVDDGSGQPDETTIELGNPLYSEILEWLQEFREKLVDDEIPVQGDSHASSSHEVSLDRYAVVVQDSATEWIRAYPCKTKTSQDTQRSFQKFLEPERKPVGDVVFLVSRLLTVSVSVRSPFQYVVVRNGKVVHRVLVELLIFFSSFS